jgi:hypothetical protein
MAYRWNMCYFDQEIEVLLDAVILRIAQMVAGIHKDDVLNTVKLGLKGLVMKEQKLYCCTPEFIDNMSLIVADMKRSFIVNNQLTKLSDTVIATDVMGNVSTAEAIKNAKKWLITEGFVLGDDRFKERLRSLCVNRSLRPGELTRYIRDNSGIKPSTGTSVIEVTRPSMQVAWLITKSIVKKQGIPLTENMPTIHRSIVYAIFNSHCESKCGFDWYTKILVSEDSFIRNPIPIVNSKYPRIVQCMGTAFVCFNKRRYRTDEPELTVLTWHNVVRTIYKYQVEMIDKTWDLFKLNDVEKAWYEPEVNELEDMVHGNVITIPLMFIDEGNKNNANNKQTNKSVAGANNKH